MITNIEPLVLAVIMLASRTLGVPGPLIAAIIMVESSFNLHALGDYGDDKKPHAFGPMQVNDKGAGYGWPQDALLDWRFNILLGTEYLKTCLDAFPNNKKLAISAYNQGIAGAAKRGYGHNEDYVEQVLQLEQDFRESWSPE